jgi:hypothetical protein
MKLFEHKGREGIYIIGVSIGKIKHLFDRYRNYLAWFQIPLLLYTALMTTVQYFPQLKGHVLEIIAAGVGCFILFTVVAMLVDFKFVFQSEREFMYGGTPYFERKFENIEKRIDIIVEAIKK